MAWINITTNDGELVERINTREYDLTRPMARASLNMAIRESIEIADQKDVEADQMKPCDKADKISRRRT